MYTNLLVEISLPSGVKWWWFGCSSCSCPEPIVVNDNFFKLPEDQRMNEWSNEWCFKNEWEWMRNLPKIASCNLSACSSRRHPASFWLLQRSSWTKRKAAEMIKNDVLVEKNDGKKDEWFTCECWNSFDNIGHMWVNDYWVILTQSGFVFIEQAFHTVSRIL